MSLTGRITTAKVQSMHAPVPGLSGRLRIPADHRGLGPISVDRDRSLSTGRHGLHIYDPEIG
jgi:hypothetical protein